MDCIGHGIAKSRTQLSDVHFQSDDYSPGDSTSALRNCSKEAGGGQYRCDVGEKGIRAIQHMFVFFCKVFLLVTRASLGAQMVKRLPAKPETPV